MNDAVIDPLVSCLCVTKRRPEHLRRAVQCFLSQTYPNTELVVVHPHNDEETRQCLASFGSDRLKPYPVAVPDISLGDLRNLSIEYATGEYACAWDDDDWYSPERIAQQYAALRASAKHVVILTRLLVHDSNQKKSWLGCERLWENSVFFDRRTVRALDIRYPGLNKLEDFHFVNALIKQNLVYPLHEAMLYIYNIDGANASETERFDVIKRRSAALSEHQNDVVRGCIELTLSPREGYEAMQAAQFKEPMPYVRPSAIRW